MNKYKILNNKLEEKKDCDEILSNGLNERFNNLVSKLQLLNEKYQIVQEIVYKIYSKNIAKNSGPVLKKYKDIWNKIKNEDLINKCRDKTFAKQLMMKNQVPAKYWEFEYLNYYK